MAGDFTQDSVLHYLQSRGGSVKNSDLLLHFRSFLRDHADQDRNRSLFKKFVNSVATVKQEDGVSHVVLRKKFKGFVPGGGGASSSGPPRRTAEAAPGKTDLSPAGSREKPRVKPQLEEATLPAGPTTILPVAGFILHNNNNNGETNFNLKRGQQQQQIIDTPSPAGRSAVAPVGGQISEKTQVRTPTLAEPPARDHCTKAGQQKVGLSPSVVAAEHVGETIKQVAVPVTHSRREAGLKPEGSPHHDPAPATLHPQVTPRRFRYRQSYRSAVSYDEDEAEEVPVKQGSAGGVWPLNGPLVHSDRAFSASSPCIIDQPAPSSASPSERKNPKIYIQTVEGEMLTSPGPGWSTGVGHRGQWAGPGLKPGCVPGDSMSTRRSLPVEHSMPSPDQAESAMLQHNIHQERRYSQHAGAQSEPRQGWSESQRARLSSSHSSIFSPSSAAGFSSSDWPTSGTQRGLNSSYEDLHVRTGETVGGVQIQEVVQQDHVTELESVTRPWPRSTHLPHNQQQQQQQQQQQFAARLSPLHHSNDHLHDDQQSKPSALMWHRSTGDLYDDLESSDGSTSSPPQRQHQGAARRLSSKLRSRMCRSLGADLDQLMQEEVTRGGAGGSEAARLDRLHRISSSLSLRYDMSSSSLSSCSTPPRCHSLADLAEGVKEGRRSLPVVTSSSTHHESPSRQSLVPLEPREHDWLVKGAAGAWPYIYSLFREDSSLLNRRDFISGFTVLHWIAKHGDHRVLNTLWYGVEKAGVTFDINARSTCGHTPLHIAAIHNNKNIMRLLVNKFDADVKLRDTAGKKPWQYLSRTAPPEIFQMLGAPSQTSGRREGGATGAEPFAERKQHHRRRRRHHLSSASSAGKPLTLSGLAKVKRSSSIAAFLKHKSLSRFHGHQSDSSV